MIRSSIKRLVELGPLPCETDAPGPRLAEIDQLLRTIEEPLDEEEARALLSAFGTDDCFGMNATLLTLVESCGVELVVEEPPPGANPWLRYHWERSQRARQSGT